LIKFNRNKELFDKNRDFRDKAKKLINLEGDIDFGYKNNF
jgi:hypothetical protein